MKAVAYNPVPGHGTDDDHDDRYRSSYDPGDHASDTFHSGGEYCGSYIAPATN